MLQQHCSIISKSLKVDCFFYKTVKLRIHMRNKKQLEDSEHVVTSDPFGTFASKFAIGIRKFSDIAQIIQTCLLQGDSFKLLFRSKTVKSCMLFILTSFVRRLHTKYSCIFLVYFVHLMFL